MNRADNCYDNAFMESCFGTIKTELEMTEYDHQQTAHREIEEYLTYYNHDRIHHGRLTRGRIPADIVYGARKVKTR